MFLNQLIAISFYLCLSCNLFDSNVKKNGKIIILLKESKWYRKNYKQTK